jgi:hypothetical protein
MVLEYQKQGRFPHLAACFRGRLSGPRAVFPGGDLPCFGGPGFNRARRGAKKKPPGGQNSKKQCNAPAGYFFNNSGKSLA